MENISVLQCISLVYHSAMYCWCRRWTNISTSTSPFCFLYLQRQVSSPDTFPCHPGAAPRGVHIHLSNVTGFQHGNNNTMVIYPTDPSDRKRHPTAPPSVNLPPPQLGSWRDKTGGVSWVHIKFSTVLLQFSTLGLSLLAQQEGHVQ